MQGTFPKKVEKDVEGKEEELFENHVKHSKEKDAGLNAEVLRKRIRKGTIISKLKLEPTSIKLLFHISKKVCCCKMCNCNKAIKNDKMENVRRLRLQY